MDEDNNVTTRLLTLLNVSALKSTKRKRADEPQVQPRDKLNKRSSVKFANAETELEKENESMVIDTTEGAEVVEEIPELQVEDEGIPRTLIPRRFMNNMLQTMLKILMKHTLAKILPF
jgi:hypothetical protein